MEEMFYTIYPNNKVFITEITVVDSNGKLIQIAGPRIRAISHDVAEIILKQKNLDSYVRVVGELIEERAYQLPSDEVPDTQPETSNN